MTTPSPFFLPIACLGLALAVPFAYSRQELQFSDEFNDKTVEVSDWSVENGPAHPGTGEKGPAQLFSPNCVTLSDGLLHVSLLKPDISDTHSKTRYSYLVGSLRSKKSYLFGRFEFRARLPKGKGLVPEISLRPELKTGPDSKIDVLEEEGAHPNVIYSTLHSDENRQYSAQLIVRPLPEPPKVHHEGMVRVEHLITLPRDLSEDFHVYGVDWQSDRVIWTFDGVPYLTVKGHVPREPMEVCLQLTLSSLEGKAEETPGSRPSLDIDYIRIWSAVK